MVFGSPQSSSRSAKEIVGCNCKSLYGQRASKIVVKDSYEFQDCQCNLFIGDSMVMRKSPLLVVRVADG